MTKEMINKYVRGENGYFMDKVEFIIKDVKRRSVKFNGVRFEIKPYINSKDMLDIASIVYSNYYKEDKDITEVARLLSSPIVENAFLLGVIANLTNIATPKDDMLDYFVDCGLADFIKQNVVNYDSCLRSIYYAIEQKNNYDRFESVKDRIDELLLGFQSTIEETGATDKTNINELQKVIKEYKDLVEGKVEYKKDKDTGKIGVQKIKEDPKDKKIEEKKVEDKKEEVKSTKTKGKTKTTKTNK